MPDTDLWNLERRGAKMLISSTISQEKAGTYDSELLFLLKRGFAKALGSAIKGKKRKNT